MEPLSYAVLCTSSFLFFNSTLVPVPSRCKSCSWSRHVLFPSSLLDLDPRSKQQQAAGRELGANTALQTVDMLTCMQTADSRQQTADCSEVFITSSSLSAADQSRKLVSPYQLLQLSTGKIDQLPAIRSPYIEKCI